MSSGKRYENLPRIDGTDYRHAWNEFPDGDRLGSLNRLSPEAVKLAASEVISGEVYQLDLVVGELDPPLFGRGQVTHTIQQTGRNFFEDKLDDFYPQASSQWDGFGHVRFKDSGFWQGRLVEPGAESFDLGIDAWAEKGVAGRGVLLDIAAYREEAGRPLAHGTNDPITAGDLLEAVECFDLNIEPGDIVCLRTGWTQWYRQLDDAAKNSLAGSLLSPGLLGTESVAQLLWDWQIAAIAADNPAIEPVPGDASLHRRLVPLLGLAVGELFDLDQIAAACHRDKRYTFLFTSAPIRMRGGLGSPANALALR